MDTEAQARLSSVLEVVEHEMRGLAALGDKRLQQVLETMALLRAEVRATLGRLDPPSSNRQ